MTTSSLAKLLTLLYLSAFIGIGTAQATWIAHEFSTKERVILNKALELTEDFDWEELTTEDKKIENIGHKKLKRRQWLSERIHYILPQVDLIDYEILSQPLNNHRYPYPKRLPQHTAFNFSIHSSETMGLIRNLSPELYLIGKEREELLSFKTKNLTAPAQDLLLITVSSPRVGILSLSKEILNQTFDKVDTLVLTSYLFHEGRHGDGHAENLGFPHSLCPPQHDYAGKLACDQAMNGAYGLSSLYFQRTLENCTECSEEEKERLRFHQLEAQARILPPAKKMDLYTLHKIHDLENRINELALKYFNEDRPDKIQEIKMQIYSLSDDIKKLQQKGVKSEKRFDPTHEEILIPKRSPIREE